jgi:DNA-binding transcriptional LysR family regulator
MAPRHDKANRAQKRKFREARPRAGSGCWSEGRPCILCRRSADVTAQSTWRLTDGKSERGVQISVRLAVSDPVAAREYCAAGLGLASLPMFVGEAAVRTGRLVRVLPGWTSPRITVRAVLPHRPTAAARAVLDHLVVEAKRRWPAYGAVSER